MKRRLLETQEKRDSVHRQANDGKCRTRAGKGEGGRIRVLQKGVIAMTKKG